MTADTISKKDIKLTHDPRDDQWYKGDIHEEVDNLITKQQQHLLANLSLQDQQIKVYFATMSLRTLQIKRDIHDQAEILQRIAQKPLTGVLDKWASLIHAYSISIRTAELPDEGAKMSNDQLMDIFMRNSKKYDLFESNMRKLTRAMKKFTKMIEVNGFASYVENVTTEISHLDGKEKTTALENAFENLCKEMNTL